MTRERFDVAVVGGGFAGIAAALAAAGFGGTAAALSADTAVPLDALAPAAGRAHILSGGG